MKEISVAQIGTHISDALESQKKNILFVSSTLEYENALNWFVEHPEHRVCRATPAALYVEENGILVKKENCPVISTEELEAMNDEKAIWFHHAFSEKSIEYFESFLDIIKHRFFINKFDNGNCVKYSLEKMALFVAFTTPYSETDWAALDEKYYELFDAVYLVK